MIKNISFLFECFLIFIIYKTKLVITKNILMKPIKLLIVYLIYKIAN